MGFIGNKTFQVFLEPGRQDWVRAKGEDVIGKVVKDYGRVSVQSMEFSLQGIIENILVIDAFHDGSHAVQFRAVCHSQCTAGHYFIGGIKIVESFAKESVIKTSQQELPYNGLGHSICHHFTGRGNEKSCGFLQFIGNLYG